MDRPIIGTTIILEGHSFDGSSLSVKHHTTIYIMTIAASHFIESKIPQYHQEYTELGTDGSQKWLV